MHMRLDQCQFFYWDSRIDPREPDYEPSQDPTGGLFLCYNISIQTKSIDAITSPSE